MEAECRYLSPARYDDVLEIATSVERLRPTRVDFRQKARLKGDERAVAEARIVLACVDRAGRPRALPPEVKDALAGPGA